MLVSISIIPDLLIKWVITWSGVALFDNCAFLCVHVSIHHRLDMRAHVSALHLSKHKHTMSMLRFAKTNWSALYKKSLPGASHFEIKSMSLCSASVPGIRERMWTCCTEGRGTLSKCCDFHSQGITQSLLSIPLNQETSGRKGRRIRLAREQAERNREWVL